MVKESARKCSLCGQNGHNSRTCNASKGSIKLLGKLIFYSIKKSKSTGNLALCHEAGAGYVAGADADAGYISDGHIESRMGKGGIQERKRGVPWTADEHQSFLLGLEKLGKGDWRGISKIYVTTRTPTQVASHAQKYFIRMTDTEKKIKRRSSLFDMHLLNETANPVSPVFPFDGETSDHQHSGNSIVSTLRSTHEAIAKGSTTTSAQVSNPSEAPQVLPPAPAYGMPDFRCMPYMVGVPNHMQSFHAANPVPFVPVMHYPNHGFMYLPRSNGNFATCAPFLSLAGPSGTSALG